MGESDVRFLACAECGEEMVNIETPTVHRSTIDYVELLGNGHIHAFNSPNSYSHDDTAAEFVCAACDYRWPVDCPVDWDWIE